MKEWVLDLFSPNPIKKVRNGQNIQRDCFLVLDKCRAMVLERREMMQWTQHSVSWMFLTAAQKSEAQCSYGAPSGCAESAGICWYSNRKETPCREESPAIYNKKLFGLWPNAVLQTRDSGSCPVLGDVGFLTKEIWLNASGGSWETRSPSFRSRNYASMP